MRVNPNQRALHALFKTYLDIVHVQKDETAQLYKASPATAAAGATQAESQEDVSQEGLSGPGLRGTETQTQTDDFVCGNLSKENIRAKEREFQVSRGFVCVSAGSPQPSIHLHQYVGGILFCLYFVLSCRGTKTLMVSINLLQAMAADKDLVTKLINSIAPKVIQMDKVKKGLLCQLFGGVSKSIAGKGNLRGDINILVVGDPSVSKSQLLGFVHKVAPRGIYTSGKGSSAVGLTAYVTKVC